MKFTSSGKRKRHKTGRPGLSYLLALLMLLGQQLYARHTDSIRSPAYIKSMTRYGKMYPFINYEINYLEWMNADALEPFFAKLSTAGSRKVKVLHIGDSHVQADFFPGFIRESMQAIFGYGGRGFVFPYACANTHATYDYRTFDYGAWECAKNIQPNPALELGISGVTSRTTDPNAGFKFIFIRPNIIRKEFDQIKIYCRQGQESFDLKMKCSGSPDTVKIDCNRNTGSAYITVKVPAIGDTIQFWADRNDSSQKYFECYGILIESSSNSGILYNSVGINGAGYTSILRQSLFPLQLAELSPDLVIIDVGANDFYPRPIVGPEFQNNLAGVIEMVRQAAPKASILVSCSQDIYKRSRNITGTKQFSEIARNVAFQKNCAFYDWYHISGGQYSMLKWLKSKLAKPDKVHLTTEGYNVKGEMYLNAMLNTYYQFLSGGLPDTFIVKNGVPALDLQLSPTPRDTAQKFRPPADNPGSGTVIEPKLIVHKIKKGETIGGIAQKYNVTIAQIRSWNNLRSNTLIAGKTLKIYVKGKEPKDDVKQNEPKPNNNNNKSQAKPAKTYVVRSGDSLWSIAQKFNTTVEKLKKANGMSSSNLKPGTKLIIPE